MKHSVFVPGFVCLAVTLLLCGPRADAQCLGQTNISTTGATAGAGGSAWQNPNRVFSANSSYTTVDAVISALGIITTTTDYLNVTNLGLTIPTTNTICGVVVTINRQNFTFLSLGSSTTTDNSILLIKGGSRVGTDHAATGVSWPSSAGTASYGSSGDLWGTTLTPSDVNASNFGVAISAKLVAQILSVAFVAEIDQVTVTVYSSSLIVLPIGLQDFTAHSSAGGNVLSWTASTSADDGGGLGGRIVVERSPDGVSWSQRDVLAAAPGQKDYSYLDASPLPGTSYYRLNLLSAGGSAVYSTVKTVTGVALTNIHCYPNPFTDMINIVSPHSFTRLLLKNLQGKTLWVKEYGEGIGTAQRDGVRTDQRDGVQTAQIPAGGLAAGVYFVQVDGSTYKIIKK